jgi:hypothetical protein
MCYTHVTDALDLACSKTFSYQISTMTDVSTHCFATGMSLSSAARQIKQLPMTNGIMSGHH